MEIQDKLRYHFAEYILYLGRNQEVQLFLNIGLFHVPPDLSGKLRANYLTCEMPYRKKLEEIFAEGMKRGIIRQGDPAQKVWSFKTKRDGVAAWVNASPDLTEEHLEDFWSDYWYGVTERKND